MKWEGFTDVSRYADYSMQMRKTVFAGLHLLGVRLTFEAYHSCSRLTLMYGLNILLVDKYEALQFSRLGVSSVTPE